MPHHHGPVLAWTENDTTRRARWLSAADRPPPERVHRAERDLTARRALVHAGRHHALLWHGDYHQARQLLDAMQRRALSRPAARPLSPAEEFHRHRQRRARAATLLGALLVELRPGGVLHLSRAPDTAAAVSQVYGTVAEPSLVTLRELLGVLNAHRQRRHGIPVATLGGARIHPHYGVFAPTRQDYLDLVARAPLPPGVGNRTGTAFDIGTGTGVLAALLVARGLRTVVATDTQARAVACARDNLRRLGLADVVECHHRDLFPRGRADLIVANPPWLPGTPASAVETGVYDRSGAMTTRFLRGLADHLRPDGEAWLIRSTLAEHLGLLRHDHIPTLVDRAGLHVQDVLEGTPTTAHRQRAPERDGDALARARRRERLQLWRLRLHRPAGTG